MKDSLTILYAIVSAFFAGMFVEHCRAHQDMPDINITIPLDCPEVPDTSQFEIGE